MDRPCPQIAGTTKPPEGARAIDHKASDSSMVTVIGVDIGKNRFHPVGLDNRGAIVLRRLTGRMAHSQARGAAELR